MKGSYRHLAVGFSLVFVLGLVPVAVDADVLIQQTDSPQIFTTINNSGDYWTIPLSSGWGGYRIDTVQIRAQGDIGSGQGFNRAGLRLMCFLDAGETQICPGTNATVSGGTYATSVSTPPFTGQVTYTLDFRNMDDVGNGPYAAASTTLPLIYDHAALRVSKVAGRGVIFYGTSTIGYYIVNGEPIFQTIGTDISTSTVWETGNTYIVSGDVEVDPGITLTIQPGAVVKFNSATSSLVVSGILAAEGTATSSIYFTSIKDDSVGGDTNGNGGANSPSAGDWGEIEIATGGVVTINFARIKYGGGNSGANLYNSGGDLSAFSLQVASSSNYGVLNTGGFTFVASSTILGNTNGVYNTGGSSQLSFNKIYNNANYGIYLAGDDALVEVSELYSNSYGVYVGAGSSGDMKIMSSNIHDNLYGVYINAGMATIGSNSLHDNSNYAVFNNAGGSLPARYNYWGAADGPDGVGPGTGDNVSADVDYSDFLDQEHYLNIAADGSGIALSVDGSEINWSGDPQYWDAWYASVATWNSLGNISVATDTIFTTLDLEVSTTTDSDLSWAGLWQSPPSGNDTLQLNTFYLDTASNIYRQGVITHELGHAIGLGHSYPGNIMHYLPSSTTTLGSQDVSDYYYLWP